MITEKEKKFTFMRANILISLIFGLTWFHSVVAVGPSTARINLGWFMIQNRMSGKVLDVPNFSKEYGLSSNNIQKMVDLTKYS